MKAMILTRRNEDDGAAEV